MKAKKKKIEIKYRMTRWRYIISAINIIITKLMRMAMIVDDVSLMKQAAAEAFFFFCLLNT
jgi:hypothetical protein